ncbi:DUF3824 domain-containing protein [Streptomyces sp. NPDC005485]|uniref:DUF3824 domain-containing protein n=1 Tax=Streptomyces sp. NPDC005485 TaxID=3155591 RepID=UPI0033B64022
MSDRITLHSILQPKQVAQALYHPVWIPESVDPSVDRLKKARIIAGAVAAFGVYTFVQRKFNFDEVLENMLTASVVVLFITPLSVGVMLFVWRRTGTVRQMRVPLFNSLKLLLFFIGSVVGLVFLWVGTTALGGFWLVPLGFTALWLTGMVAYGAVQVSGNFFGTAAVHRCLPPLLATITTWLMALPDLLTGDLHGLSFKMGIVFILGAPVTVTAIAMLEMRRLKRRYGIRLSAHPATLPQPRPAYTPVNNGFMPPQGHPYPPGNPYGAGHPYAPHPQGSPYPPGSPNPYGPGPYGS